MAGDIRTDAEGFVQVGRPLPSATLTGSADTVGKAVAAMAQAGATEVMYEPSGPDIARELEAFISAVRG